MAHIELDQCLVELDLTQTGLAKYLSVDPRTVRRWVENPSQMPGPAVEALRAWRRLKKFDLEWRPNHIDLRDDEALTQFVDEYRRQSFEIVAAAVKRVEEQGGPKAPWRVNLDAGEATLGHLKVYFYETSDGRIAPNSYAYLDGRDIDTERDCQLIDDAYALIVAELVKRNQRVSA